MQLLTEMYVSLFRITDNNFSIFYSFYKTVIVMELVVHASPDQFVQNKLFFKHAHKNLSSSILECLL